MPSLLSDVKTTVDAFVVIAIDIKTDAGFERRYFACSGGMLDSKTPKGVTRAADLPIETSGRIKVIVYPTRTYSEGMGGGMFTEIAPEDRSVIRGLERRFPGRVDCVKVPLGKTGLFASLDNYFKNDDERAAYEEQRAIVPAEDSSEDKDGAWLAFDGGYIENMSSIFKSCMTKPNRQDYMWLVTKTFTLNLAIRMFFMVKSVGSGDLPMMRAVVSTSWYQLQDAVFTVFGQTYMKFLGKMTPMVKIKNAAVGDLVFVYIQLCSMEFINRLVLGPLGENPLVYTVEGVGLIFVNILQGMISGGPIIPAVNKMRKVGAISHSTMMHFYQIASLTMQLGLFAAFGYQTFYAILTGVILVFAWGSYLFFSTMFKEPTFGSIEDEETLSAVDLFAGRCCAA